MNGWKYSLVGIVIVFVLLFISVINLFAKGPVLGVPVGGGSVPPPAQTISSLTVSGSSTVASFTSGVANAVVGPVVVTMSPAAPPFSGAITLDGGANNTEGFDLSGSTSGSNLLAPAGGLSVGNYTDVVIRATQGPLVFTINPTLTATAPQTIASLTVSGSSTAASFNSNSGSVLVGPIAVTMSPAAPSFSGVVSLDGGANNTEGFQLSSSTLPSNLLAPVGGLSVGNYTDVVIRAHQTGLTDLTINPILTATTPPVSAGLLVSSDSSALIMTDDGTNLITAE